jgi:hypothetical protein
MRYAVTRHAFFWIPAILVGAPLTTQSLHAQELAELCPEEDPAGAVLVGFVQDSESGMVLPGAEVTASWVREGERERTLTQVGIDGGFTLCGLPREIEVTVRAAFANRRGPSAILVMNDAVGQYDLMVSLSEDAPEEESEEIVVEGRASRAFSATLITEEDLAALPAMPLYDMLRQHNRLRFERLSGGGEVIMFTDRSSTSVVGGQFRGVQVYVDERRVPDSISAIRDLYTDEVKRLEILDSGEASARYGGDGWIGIISIRTRD